MTTQTLERDANTDKASLSHNYVAFPLYPRPQVISNILRNLLRFDTLFTNFNAPDCEDDCADNDGLCETCAAKMQIASWHMNAPDSRVWEVWKEFSDPQEIPELTGIIVFTNIIPGKDARAHYVFFDRDLRGKTSVLRDVMDWVFTDHPDDGWEALRRITVEIPVPFFALASHASRYLGFDGPFEYTVETRSGRTKQLEVEGVKRDAILWRDSPTDVLVLSKLNTS